MSLINTNGFLRVFVRFKMDKILKSESKTHFNCFDFLNLKITKLETVLKN